MTTDAKPDYRKFYLDASVNSAAIKNESGREAPGQPLTEPPSPPGERLRTAEAD